MKAIDVKAGDFSPGYYQAIKDAEKIENHKVQVKVRYLTTGITEYRIWGVLEETGMMPAAQQPLF